MRKKFNPLDKCTQTRGRVCRPRLKRKAVCVLSSRAAHMKTKSARFKKILLFLSLIIFGLSLIQLFLANQLATEGTKLKKIQEQTQSLVNENAKLNEAIVKISSLAYIEEQAKNSDMVKISQVEFVTAAQVAQAR